MDQYPLFYRIMFLWLEPVSMGGGAIQAALDPAKLIELSLPGVHYSADMRPLMLGFSGSWLLMFYQRIVTLRRFTSRRAWTDVLIAHSISDLYVGKAAWHALRHVEGSKLTCLSFRPPCASAASISQRISIASAGCVLVQGGAPLFFIKPVTLIVTIVLPHLLTGTLPQPGSVDAG